MYDLCIYNAYFAMQGDLCYFVNRSFQNQLLRAYLIYFRHGVVTVQRFLPRCRMTTKSNCNLTAPHGHFSKTVFQSFNHDRVLKLSKCRAVLQLMLASQPWKTSKRGNGLFKLLWIFSLNRDRIRIAVCGSVNPLCKGVKCARLCTLFPSRCCLT